MCKCEDNIKMNITDTRCDVTGFIWLGIWFSCRTYWKHEFTC